MRLLADECIAGALVKRLRQLGLDVEWVTERASGSTDEEVLKRSIVTERILLTEDYDFADLIFRFGRHATGVIILSASLSARPPEEVAATIGIRLAKPASEYGGILTIFEVDRTRQRALPRS